MELSLIDVDEIVNIENEDKNCDHKWKYLERRSLLDPDIYKCEICGAKKSVVLIKIYPIRRF